MSSANILLQIDSDGEIWIPYILPCECFIYSQANNSLVEGSKSIEARRHPCQTPLSKIICFENWPLMGILNYSLIIRPCIITRNLLPNFMAKICPNIIKIHYIKFFRVELSNSANLPNLNASTNRILYTLLI